MRDPIKHFEQYMLEMGYANEETLELTRNKVRRSAFFSLRTVWLLSFVRTLQKWRVVADNSFVWALCRPVGFIWMHARRRLYCSLFLSSADCSVAALLQKRTASSVDVRLYYAQFM